MQKGFYLARQIDAAIVKLGKQLRSLNKLALKVTAVQPISPAARHTSAFAPKPHAYAGGRGSKTEGVARCLTPLDVLVKLEGSGILHSSSRTNANDSLEA